MTVPKNHPHWKRMQFKANKVWMAVDAADQPIVKNGKALIKYQLNQDHEYWVFAKSLTDLGEAPTRAAARPPKAGTAKAAVARQADIDPAGAIQVFTDGACSGNPGPAGIGIILRYKGKEKEISKYIGSATNNIAELEAIRVALSSIKDKKLPVVLYTDSQYALGLLTQGWKARQNTELVGEIRKLVSRFPKLQIIKVKGHAGHPENERADRLAVQAIENGK
ncbi:MAG: ribonuclease HI [Desulfosarcinaceae bacterium]